MRIVSPAVAGCEREIAGRPGTGTASSTWPRSKRSHALTKSPCFARSRPCSNRSVAGSSGVASGAGCANVTDDTNKAASAPLIARDTTLRRELLGVLEIRLHVECNGLVGGEVL